MAVIERPCFYVDDLVMPGRQELKLAGYEVQAPCKGAGASVVSPPRGASISLLAPRAAG
jgi:hypothetical protein